jgi:acyl carrier protein
MKRRLDGEGRRGAGMSDNGEPLKTEIKQAIVRCLRLPISPSEIGDDTPLFFEEGLGLDSIDVLELVLELERSFGVAIRDEETGMVALKSVNSIHEFILKERAGAT